MSSLTPLPMNTSSALTPATPRLCCCITTASRAGNTPFWWQVSFARLQVLDHREPHRLRRAEAEQAGIADVERDDLVAAPLHLVRAPRQVAADFIADVGEAGAGDGWCA
jgi:hypothetical protein